ncbi:hypothetical protein MKZ38_009732 [Zalerion maritima]|uniref:Uncharacterized protein n=1 Tax=Zalerion maritima TaxID=339359 RepID=A0AAD5RT45_9PEZI|nr:hypothetical protein MKZ38_009732 [Zalerion maritima]
MARFSRSEMVKLPTRNYYPKPEGEIIGMEGSRHWGNSWVRLAPAKMETAGDTHEPYDEWARPTKGEDVYDHLDRKSREYHDRQFNYWYTTNNFSAEPVPAGYVRLFGYKMRNDQKDVPVDSPGVKDWIEIGKPYMMGPPADSRKGPGKRCRVADWVDDVEAEMRGPKKLKAAVAGTAAGTAGALYKFDEGYEGDHEQEDRVTRRGDKDGKYALRGTGLATVMMDLSRKEVFSFPHKYELQDAMFCCMMENIKFTFTSNNPETHRYPHNNPTEVALIHHLRILCTGKQLPQKAINGIHGIFFKPYLSREIAFYEAKIMEAAQQAVQPEVAQEVEDAAEQAMEQNSDHENDHEAVAEDGGQDEEDSGEELGEESQTKTTKARAVEKAKKGKKGNKKGKKKGKKGKKSKKGKKKAPEPTDDNAHTAAQNAQPTAQNLSPQPEARATGKPASERVEYKPVRIPLINTKLKETIANMNDRLVAEIPGYKPDEPGTSEQGGKPKTYIPRLSEFALWNILDDN